MEQRGRTLEGCQVIEQVQKAWGVQIRDGFGQTESTVQIGNSPGHPVQPGSMGRPIPGYPIELVDPVSGAAGVQEGEICIDLSRRPLGLMTGYSGDPERNAEVMAGAPAAPAASTSEESSAAH